MENKSVTAVDWLINELNLNEIIEKNNLIIVSDIIKQAKVMDKEQSRRDYYAGLEGYIIEGGGFEGYYNETYNK